MIHRTQSHSWICALVLGLFAAGCRYRSVPIFLWHSVGEGQPGDQYDLTPDEFDAQLTLIEKFGATPITLTQLFDAEDSKGPLPKRPVVLTFDDGRACLYTQALPILKKHQMTAENFVVTSYLGEDAQHRVIRQDDQGEHPYLLWSEAKVMQESGFFKTESHSSNHLRMGLVDEEVQQKELVESKQDLERRLKVSIPFFAYPFGSFNTPSLRLAQAAGYRAALAVDKGIGRRYALKRVSVWRDSTPKVEQALQRAFGSAL